MLKKKIHGKNFPPLHSFCRCTTVAEFDDDITDGLQRRARDENGNSILVPQNMTYKEWYNQYIEKEEGIIDNLFNKKQKVQYKDITEQKSNLINQSFKNNNIKNIALNTEIKSIKIGGNKAYHRNGNIVLKINYDNHTIRHEIAHAVDYNNKWLSSNKKFVQAIQKDKKIILNNKEFYKTLLKNNSNNIELSDIMSGITDNKIKGRYRHDNKYWKKPHKLEREIFAQMFTVAGKDDLKQLGMLQKHLPNSFKEFDSLIRRIL